MTTMSISIDEKLKEEIEKISNEDGVSKSVVIRRLLEQATWERTWKDMSSEIRNRLDDLNINSIDELETYLG